MPGSAGLNARFPKRPIRRDDDRFHLPRKNGTNMAGTNFRPKYISFDVYGTLINFDIDPTTRRLLDGRISEEQWPTFKKQFRGYRFDEVLGDYKPYEQILQDSFDRVCKRWGIGPTEGAGAEFAEAVRG